MRVKISTDPTIPNPQDPKDAPHSQNGGGNGFMPYAPAWERLADAIRRVTAGRRPKGLAQTDLCRAIADGTIKIRCKLKRHKGGLISKAALEGKDFDVPTEIKPEDLDWERSCPVKPWNVRRGSYSVPGYWDLELIEVCTGDVTKALCVSNEQDPVGSGRRSTARPRKPRAPGRRRGARPAKFEKAKDAMMNDIRQGRLTVAQLQDMLEKNLAAMYGVSRDTARKARKAVLLE